MAGREKKAEATSKVNKMTWVIYENTKYFVNRGGQIKGPRKILKSTLGSTGYLVVEINKKQVKVHRVVAESLIPNPLSKTQVNHINGVKTDNRVENLEWCTQKQNVYHAWATGLCKPSKGENNGRSKLTLKQVREIRNLYSNTNTSYRKLAAVFGVTFAHIGKIVNRRNWDV